MHFSGASVCCLSIVVGVAFPDRQDVNRLTPGQNVSWVAQHVHFYIPRVTEVPSLNGGRWITLTEIAMFNGSA